MDKERKPCFGLLQLASDLEKLLEPILVNVPSISIPFSQVSSEKLHVSTPIISSEACGSNMTVLQHAARVTAYQAHEMAQHPQRTPWRPLHVLNCFEPRSSLRGGRMGANVACVLPWLARVFPMTMNLSSLINKKDVLKVNSGKSFCLGLGPLKLHRLNQRP